MNKDFFDEYCIDDFFIYDFGIFYYEDEWFVFILIRV